MSERAVVDENGYLCFCEAYEEPQGVWRALVRFERKSDHAAMKTHIPGMTHKIDETFATHHEAMGAAKAYARYKASQDETGLQTGRRAFPTAESGAKSACRLPRRSSASVPPDR